MILGALAFHLFVWVVPVALLVAVRPSWRARAYALVPLGCLAQGFFLGVLSSVSYPLLYPGWAKLGMVSVAASGATGWVLSYANERLHGFRAAAFSTRALLLCALGAGVATADLVAIFSGQGFPFEKGRLIHAGETYFRPPMNNDLTRHVVVVNSLLRRSPDTPFLPESRFSYQLFWHHFAGLTIGPLADWLNLPTNYPLVVGHVAAVALVFFFLLIWSLHARRPSLFSSPPLAIALGVLVLSHADVFHIVKSVLSSGAPGIEADWSARDTLFRNFSAKLMGLTAPQHALFFLFFLGYLNRRRWVRGWIAQGMFVLPCAAASPVLSLFLFPVWWAGEAARSYSHPRLVLTQIGRYTAVAAASLLAYALVLRSNPIDLFTRQGVSSVLYFPADLFHWAQLPLLWIASAGVLGLAVVAVTSRRWAWPFLAVLLVALPALNYVVSGQEIRRHFSMIAAVVCALFLVRAIPRRSVLARRLVFLGALICVPLHAYFVFCYLGKPSSLATGIPWQDYYGVNSIIQSRFPNGPTLAAVQPGGGIGLEKPMVMEVTTSLSIPYHTIAHVSPTPAQMGLLSRVARSGETIPYGRELGYRYLIWGPVEEQVWGARNRERFVDGNEPLVRVGAVGLYALRDRYRELPEFSHRGNVSIRARYAEFLAAKGFPVEAAEEYEIIAGTEKPPSEMLLRFARLRILVGDPSGAIAIVDRVLATEPSSAEAYSFRGAALARMGQLIAAVESYRHVLQLRPDDARARNNLALLLNQLGDFLGAEEQLRPLVDLASPAPSTLIHFAQALLGQQRYKEAVPPLRRCLASDGNPSLQLQAHLSLGQAYNGLRQIESAAAHFAEALKINPAAEPALAFFRNPR